MASEVHDGELIAAVIQRDDSALEQLMARYRSAIHHHLVGIVRDTMLAEDLVQEVFLRVWTRADSWDGRGPLKAWLFRIATNQALNHLRSKRRHPEHVLDLHEAADPNVEKSNDSDWPSDLGNEGPEAWVTLAERHEQLRQAIDRLPPGKADVVRLMYEQDLTPHEVAEVLGIPQGTVRSRLHHARKHLSHLRHNDTEE